MSLFAHTPTDLVTVQTDAKACDRPVVRPPRQAARKGRRQQCGLVRRYEDSFVVRNDPSDRTGDFLHWLRGYNHSLDGASPVMADEQTSAKMEDMWGTSTTRCDGGRTDISEDGGHVGHEHNQV